MNRVIAIGELYSVVSWELARQLGVDMPSGGWNFVVGRRETGEVSCPGALNGVSSVQSPEEQRSGRVMPL